MGEKKARHAGKDKDKLFSCLLILCFPFGTSLNELHCVVLAYYFLEAKLFTSKGLKYPPMYSHIWKAAATCCYSNVNIYLPRTRPLNVIAVGGSSSRLLHYSCFPSAFEAVALPERGGGGRRP